MARTLAVVTAVLVASGVPAAADDPAPGGAAPAPAPAPTPAPAAAGAVPDYFAPKTIGTVRVRRDRSRSRRDRLLIAGLAGGAAIFGGAAVYFHYDSNRIADELSADSSTMLRWSDELADKYDRGQQAGAIAIVSYVIAGALAAGTAIVVWRSDPGSEVIEVPVVKGAVPTAAAIHGGGVMGAAWRF